MKRILKLMFLSLFMFSFVVGMVGCNSIRTEETEETTQVESGETKTEEEKENTETSTEAVAEEETEAETEDDNEIVIGMVPTSIANNPLYMFLVEGCQALATEKGVVLTTTDVKMDASLQITAIENLIAQKVDVIVVDPVDPAAISDLISKAMEQGIKVISLSGKTDAYDSYLTIDHRQVGYVEGQMAATWINEKLGGSGEVGILNYRLGSVLIDREDGMREALEKECPGAKIVAEGQADNPTDGMKVVENFLQAHPDIKVILSVNDAAALGAVEAVKAAGKDGDDFAIFGADSAPEAIAQIVEGSILRGTVYIYPEELPGIIIDSSIKHAKGEPVDELIVGRIDGLTKDNYDQIIKQ